MDMGSFPAANRRAIWAQHRGGDFQPEKWGTIARSASAAVTAEPLVGFGVTTGGRGAPAGSAVTGYTVRCCSVPGQCGGVREKRSFSRCR